MKILKFLHASDFQLHIPVTCWPVSILAERKVLESANGSSDASFQCDVLTSQIPLERTESWLFGAPFPEIPETLTEECLAAPWKSAERAFDIALEQNVDFLLLTGDVLQPDLTGPRGLVFLVNQFRRLQERGISVYWKLERSIEEWLLPNFQFPENVFLLPADESHIKKFRLADSSKNIFIVSWNSQKPDFSRYDFSKLQDKKLPQNQTIALCRDEQMFFKAIGKSSAAPKGNCTIIENKIQRRKQNSKIEVSRENRNPESTEFPFTSAIYVGLTGKSERTTLKYDLSPPPQGEEVLQSILHSPGPTLRHSPDIWKVGQTVGSAGVSIIQMDLDGDLPISIQFFPTETITWSFFEKQIPENVQNWENLRSWCVHELNAEFQTPNNSSTQSNFVRAFVYWRLTAEKNAQNKLLRILFTEIFQNAGFQSNEGTPNLSNLLKNLRNAGENLKNHPWTVSISPVYNGLIPASWSQGESMLRSFLRLTHVHLKKQNSENSTLDPKSEEFIPHSLDLKEFLTENQQKKGLGVLGELTNDDERVFLELAAILGAGFFAENQEGGLKK